ncbi:coiled-coil-helix-coiled-coil-helix domain-containing protein 7 isoform X2 [Carettochelys insculpta]|uniref:coiled-coil-helix-coiled-coil-helix domain-containing protein 7 isoform X2 n=1 Tax=Carettochelys insculpta TaxID=44489 RepID=UPI003EB9469F
MSRNVQRLRDHDANPCIAETDASRQCMDDNNYRKDMCSSYFLKYKNCRKFWPWDREDARYLNILDNREHAIMIQRRREGVKPNMPTAKERESMLTSIGETPY